MGSRFNSRLNDLRKASEFIGLTAGVTEYPCEDSANDSYDGNDPEDSKPGECYRGVGSGGKEEGDQGPSDDELCEGTGSRAYFAAQEKEVRCPTLDAIDDARAVFCAAFWASDGHMPLGVGGFDPPLFDHDFFASVHVAH